MTFSASSADERVLDVQFTDDTISVNLRDGRVITVPLVWYPRLLEATLSQRQHWKIAGGGYGIHWPDIDEDLSTEGLLRGAPAPKASAGIRGRSIHRERGHVVISDLERKIILNTIKHLNGDKVMAAQLLGIGKTTLNRKLKQYAERGKRQTG